MIGSECWHRKIRRGSHCVAAVVAEVMACKKKKKKEEEEERICRKRMAGKRKEVNERRSRKNGIDSRIMGSDLPAFMIMMLSLLLSVYGDAQADDHTAIFD